MKRISTLLVVSLLAAASLSTLAGARPAAHSSLFHTVEVRKTKVGKILVNAAGTILYEFTKDHPKKNTCVKISGCSAIWAALPVQGKPSAGPGVKASLLSTITVPGVGTQVTYAGHPLYIYVAAPTSTSYVGVSQFGGNWYAVNGKGQAVK